MANANRIQRRRAKQRVIRKLKRVKQAVFDKQLRASEALIDPSVMSVIVDALRLGKGTATHGHRNGQYTDKGYKVSRSSSNRELFHRKRNVAVMHVEEGGEMVVMLDDDGQPVTFQQADIRGTGGIRKLGNTVCRVPSASEWTLIEIPEAEEDTADTFEGGVHMWTLILEDFDRLEARKKIARMRAEE
jgi:hypothetical protein